MGKKVVIVDKNWWKDERKSADSIVIAKPVKLAEKYFTVKQLAERLCVSINVIYDLIVAGKLEALHIGRVKRISKESVEAYLQKAQMRRA